jgi:hypothetical protein
VVLPPGGAEVVFRFESDSYDRGWLISIVALLGTAVLLSSGLWRRRSAA